MHIHHMYLCTQAYSVMSEQSYRNRGLNLSRLQLLSILRDHGANFTFMHLPPPAPCLLPLDEALGLLGRGQHGTFWGSCTPSNDSNARGEAHRKRAPQPLCWLCAFEPAIPHPPTHPGQGVRGLSAAFLACPTEKASGRSGSLR